MIIGQYIKNVQFIIDFIKGINKKYSKKNINEIVGVAAELATQTGDFIEFRGFEPGQIRLLANLYNQLGELIDTLSTRSWGSTLTFGLYRDEDYGDSILRLKEVRNSLLDIALLERYILHGESIFNSIGAATSPIASTPPSSSGTAAAQESFDNDVPVAATSAAVSLSYPAPITFTTPSNTTSVAATSSDDEEANVEPTQPVQPSFTTLMSTSSSIYGDIKTTETRTAQEQMMNGGFPLVGNSSSAATPAPVTASSSSSMVTAPALASESLVTVNTETPADALMQSIDKLIDIDDRGRFAIRHESDKKRLASELENIISLCTKESLSEIRHYFDQMNEFCNGIEGILKELKRIVKSTNDSVLIAQGNILLGFLKQIDPNSHIQFPASTSQITVNTQTPETPAPVTASSSSSMVAGPNTSTTKLIAIVRPLIEKFIDACNDLEKNLTSDQLTQFRHDFDEQSGYLRTLIHLYLDDPDVTTTLQTSEYIPIAKDIYQRLESLYSLLHHLNQNDLITASPGGKLQLEEDVDSLLNAIKQNVISPYNDKKQIEESQNQQNLQRAKEEETQRTFQELQNQYTQAQGQLLQQKQALMQLQPSTAVSTTTATTPVIATSTAPVSSGQPQPYVAPTATNTNVQATKEFQKFLKELEDIFVNKTVYDALQKIFTASQAKQTLPDGTMKTLNQYVASWNSLLGNFTNANMSLTPDILKMLSEIIFNLNSINIELVRISSIPNTVVNSELTTQVNNLQVGLQQIQNVYIASTPAIPTAPVSSRQPQANTSPIDDIIPDVPPLEFNQSFAAQLQFAEESEKQRKLIETLEGQLAIYQLAALNSASASSANEEEIIKLKNKLESLQNQSGKDVEVKTLTDQIKVLEATYAKQKQEAEDLKRQNELLQRQIESIKAVPASDNIPVAPSMDNKDNEEDEKAEQAEQDKKNEQETEITINRNLGASLDIIGKGAWPKLKSAKDRVLNTQKPNNLKGADAMFHQIRQIGKGRINKPAAPLEPLQARTPEQRRYYGEKLNLEIGYKNFQLKVEKLKLEIESLENAIKACNAEIGRIDLKNSKLKMKTRDNEYKSKKKIKKQVDTEIDKLSGDKKVKENEIKDFEEQIKKNKEEFEKAKLNLAKSKQVLDSFLKKPVPAAPTVIVQEKPANLKTTLFEQIKLKQVKKQPPTATTQKPDQQLSKFGIQLKKVLEKDPPMTMVSKQSMMQPYPPHKLEEETKYSKQEEPVPAEEPNPAIQGQQPTQETEPAPEPQPPSASEEGPTDEDGRPSTPSNPRGS